MNLGPMQEILGLTQADVALERAALQARRAAALAGVPLIVWQDGRMVRLPAKLPSDETPAAPVDGSRRG